MPNFPDENATYSWYAENDPCPLAQSLVFTSALQLFVIMSH